MANEEREDLETGSGVLDEDMLDKVSGGGLDLLQPLPPDREKGSRMTNLTCG